MSHRKQTVPTINYEDCINISSRESIHEEQSNEKVNNFSMLSKKYFNISFKPEVQKQSTLTPSGCHEESQLHLSTIIHSVSFVSCSGLTLIHPPHPPSPSQSFDTYRDIIPSIYGSFPSKVQNEFRTISCHT